MVGREVYRPGQVTLSSREDFPAVKNYYEKKWWDPDLFS